MEEFYKGGKTLKPIMRYEKKIAKHQNRLILPAPFVEQWGKDVIIEVYGDYLKIIPKKKNK